MPTPQDIDQQLAERLDNPIWTALTTDHAPLALGDGHARRYPPDIGPLSGLSAQSSQSYASLARLAGPGGAVGLFLQEPLQLHDGWTLLRGGDIDQMIAPQPRPLPPADLPGVELRRLTASDAPAMVELAHLTEPGPFQLRTLELGTFYGVLQSGRLLAMAGKRLHVPGAIEVSGVCTHPDARGRGYARHLMSRVMEEILQAGRMPFLHALASNESAIRIYQSLGFVRRRSFELAAIRRDA
ncbi:MAG TPA: GNAT family N-acetyltransferase [Acidobacteriaceae bacterium]|jgi:ribosomal protein S18 acetylase RimI-like enzyme|nr:GNAT family N-acetyltransferase [Acidobacteriaceae bacterium]